MGESGDQNGSALDQSSYTQRIEQKDGFKAGTRELGTDQYDKLGKLKKSKEKQVVETDRKKARVVLKVEPGDGLIHLSWRIVDHRPKQGEPPVKFTLFYGIESGRYDRKLEIGDGLDGALRFDIRMQGERATVFFAV